MENNDLNDRFLIRNMKTIRKRHSIFKIYHPNINQKKAKDKTRKITKGKILLNDKMVSLPRRHNDLNVYTNYNLNSKYMKQKLMKLERNTSTAIIKDFSTSLNVDRTTCQKMIMDIKGLNNTINQKD